MCGSGGRARRGRPSAQGRRGPARALFLLGALLAPAPAGAQLTLWERGDAALELGGYVRTLAGVSHVSYELPSGDPTTGFNAQVLRLEWQMRLGGRALVRVHDKIQLQVSSSSAGLGEAVAGFGVSATPGRAADLRHDFIRRERVQAWHDVDRLSLTLYTRAGDVTLGRQAVTWGVSTLFPVADLWAAFSPFELDTEEKPGVDAVRWLSYPGEGWEIDAVVADRGAREDWSAGVRASKVLRWADVWVGGGKLWREAMAMGGISAPVGSWKLRGEAVLPYDLDDEAWDGARVTVGVDWLAGALVVTGELHRNGVGAVDAGDYTAVIADERFRRGESYYMGRDYLGVLVSWSPGNDRLNVSLSALANLRDPSTAWTPVVTYDMGQSARISFGGVLTQGDPPALGEGLRFRSEYGTYGDLGFTRISLYF